jgi:hypothetical protein
MTESQRIAINMRLSRIILELKHYYHGEDEDKAVEIIATWLTIKAASHKKRNIILYVFASHQWTKFSVDRDNNYYHYVILRKTGLLRNKNYAMLSSGRVRLGSTRLVGHHGRMAASLGMMSSSVIAVGALTLRMLGMASAHGAPQMQRVSPSYRGTMGGTSSTTSPSIHVHSELCITACLKWQRVILPEWGRRTGIPSSARSMATKGGLDGVGRTW